MTFALNHSSLLEAYVSPEMMDIIYATYIVILGLLKKLLLHQKFKTYSKRYGNLFKTTKVCLILTQKVIILHKNHGVSQITHMGR